MIPMILPISGVLIISLVLNLWFFYLLRKPAKKTESLELREFLADLMGGPAMLAIARLDPNDIIMRSPKNR